MPKKVSRRECRKIMADLLARLGPSLYLDREENETFFQSLQPDHGIRPALLYLEAKGYLKLGISPVSQKLYRISITDKGRTYFEDAAQARREKQVSWTQYVITTVIAVLGLLVAIAAVLLQVLRT